MNEHRLLKQWFADVESILEHEPGVYRRTYLLDGLRRARFRCHIDPAPEFDIDAFYPD